MQNLQGQVWRSLRGDDRECGTVENRWQGLPSPSAVCCVRAIRDGSDAALGMGKSFVDVCLQKAC